MKKSMIRIATIALAVVMLSTCAITSIVAGYSVSDNASVTATVSGFGIEVAVAEATDANKTLVPGGSGNLLTVHADSDNGPVVDAALELDATVTFPTICAPIVIYVNDTPVSQGTEETYAAAVEKAIEAVTATYANKTAVNNEQELIVSWAWAAGSSDNTVLDGTQITIAVTATIAQVEAPVES